MIITLKGANFSENNIGTLTTVSVLFSLGAGATTSSPIIAERNKSYTATITLQDNYEVGSTGVTVTMGGTAVSGAVTINGKTITVTIANVTGAINITVPTVNTSTGGEGGGDVVEPEEPNTQYVFNYDFTNNTIDDYALDGVFTVPDGSSTSSIEYDSIKGMSLNNNFKALPLVTPLDAGKSWEIEIVGTFITPTDLALNRRGFISSENTNPFVFFNGSTASQMTFQFGYGSSKNFYLASGKIQFDKETTWKCVYDSETTTFTLYQDGEEIGTTTNTAYSLTGQNFTAILGNAGTSNAYIWKNEEGKKSYLKKFSFRYI